VFYGSGASANAAKIADYFGGTAKSVTSLPVGHVEVLIGTGATVVPSSLAAASATPQNAPASASAGNNGAAGGAVTVAAQAKTASLRVLAGGDLLWTSHVAKLIAGKVLYGAVCLFAAVLLVVAGYAHRVVGQVNATGQGITIKGRQHLSPSAR